MSSEFEKVYAIYILNSVKGFGPQSFKKIRALGHEAQDILDDPQKFELKGKRGDSLRKKIKEIKSDEIEVSKKRARKQIEVARENQAVIITYGDSYYPKNIFDSNNAVPVLYAKGNLDILKKQKVVACVGSRNIRSPYAEYHRSLTTIAVDLGFTISSGFANGADTIGHKTALQELGSTICVMPCGLDRPFPPENKELWKEFANSKNAVFLSEFPFGTGANSLNLRKRNKLIVASSVGVLVSQSSTKGGAMNAYRFAIEAKKPVATFVDDGTEDTSGNKFIADAKNQNSILTVDKAGMEQWLYKLSF